MNINNIPTFLKARSPTGLRRLMLNNNMKNGLIFEYKIMQDVKSGVWYAWYQADAMTALEEIFTDKKAGDE